MGWDLEKASTIWRKVAFCWRKKKLITSMSGKCNFKSGQVSNPDIFQNNFLMLEMGYPRIKNLSRHWEFQWDIPVILNYPLSTFWKIRPPNTCHRNNHLLLISNSPFTFGAGPESPSRRIHHSFNGFGVAATNSAHGSLLSLAAWPQLLVETPRLLLFGKTYCTNQLMQKRQAPIRCCFPQNFPFAVWTY